MVAPLPSPEDLDAHKREPVGAPRYRLRNARVYVTPSGFHHTDHLDPVGAEATAPAEVPEATRRHIEQEMQSNSARIERLVALVSEHLPLTAARTLDIGCGGGAFPAALHRGGATACGIEVAPDRLAYARQHHGIEIHGRPIDDPFWEAERFAGAFDLVTLWDVIEHVNFPVATLRSALRVLRPGGWLMLDTIPRDSLPHHLGVLSHRIGGGRLPTLLDSIYSDNPFGHKQVFATRELADLVGGLGATVERLEKFHELSYPVDFHLARILRSEGAIRVARPLARAVLAAFPIRNRMLLLARRNSGP